MGGSERARAMFFSHGSGPYVLMGNDHQRPLVNVLQSHAHILDNARGIIIFTAHWETTHPHISAASNPQLYYDYAGTPGLPQEAFEYRYDAPGDPDLAARISSTLQAAGFQPILDTERGWDHGVFVPLIVMRPQADLPVIQMSILKGESDGSEAEKNLRYGAAMERFRDEGYVFLFSGSSYHHLAKVLEALPERMGNGKVDVSTQEFEAELERVVAISDADKRSAILRTWRQFPQGYEAHPAGKAEHFMPFLIGAGAAGNDKGERTQSWELFGATMSTFVW